MILFDQESSRPQQLHSSLINLTLFAHRFVNTEKWRKEFGTDDLPATFEYPEKPEVFKFYPQYYHKTDKVSTQFFRLIPLSILEISPRAQPD